MALKVKYLGLELNSPVVIASSPFTNSTDKIMLLEEKGAGAVVLKSVFEEQIEGEAAFLEHYNDYPEAADYLKGYITDDYIRGHLNLIADAKVKTNIPIIASVNCQHSDSWIDYAKSIESAGADALEVNIFMLPTDPAVTAAEIEARYLEVIHDITSAISIPVSVKLTSRFTNILNVAKQIYYHGGRGVVLFNRFFEPDIDVNNIALTSSDGFSSNSELKKNLRTIGLCASAVPELDIAVSTGVHTGEDVVKCLLTGAKVAEVCTALYLNGLGVIGEMNDYLRKWMEDHTVTEASQFVGKLSYGSAGNEDLYQRAQYMKYFPKS